MRKLSKTRLHPDTHLCVDLKVISRKPGHMYVTASKGGVLQRDGEDHFTFFEDALFEDASVRSAARRRTSYRSQRFRTRDGVALALIATLATVDALALARVCGGWHYYPTMGSFSAWWLYLPHAVLLALPLVATAVEDLRWSHAESSERAAA